MRAREKWSIFDSFFFETYTTPFRVPSLPNSQECGEFVLCSKVQTHSDELSICLNPSLPLINFLGDLVPLVLESALLCVYIQFFSRVVFFSMF